MQTEPEREIARRVLPLGLPAMGIAFAAGALFAGTGAGASAAIGIAVVFGNVAAHAWSLARAARVSVTALASVAAGGFVLRLAVIVAAMALLNRFAFFSQVAFAAALIPTTIAVLAYELKLLGGPAGQQWLERPIT